MVYDVMFDSIFIDTDINLVSSSSYLVEIIMEILANSFNDEVLS